MNANPTIIRGTLYPSQRAAAAALGVHVATVHQALERGRADFVGLAIKGRPGRPCYINGKRWPSQAACARALGVRPATISRALGEGRTTVRTGAARA